MLASPPVGSGIGAEGAGTVSRSPKPPLPDPEAVVTDPVTAPAVGTATNLGIKKVDPHLNTPRVLRLLDTLNTSIRQIEEKARAAFSALTEAIHTVKSTSSSTTTQQGQTAAILNEVAATHGTLGGRLATTGEQQLAQVMTEVAATHGTLGGRLATTGEQQLSQVMTEVAATHGTLGGRLATTGEQQLAQVMTEVAATHGTLGGRLATTGAQQLSQVMTEVAATHGTLGGRLATTGTQQLQSISGEVAEPSAQNQEKAKDYLASFRIIIKTMMNEIPLKGNETEKWDDIFEERDVELTVELLEAAQEQMVIIKDIFTSDEFVTANPDQLNELRRALDTIGELIGVSEKTPEGNPDRETNPHIAMLKNVAQAAQDNLSPNGDIDILANIPECQEALSIIMDHRNESESALVKSFKMYLFESTAGARVIGYGQGLEASDAGNSEYIAVHTIVESGEHSPAAEAAFLNNLRHATLEEIDELFTILETIQGVFETFFDSIETRSRSITAASLAG